MNYLLRRRKLGKGSSEGISHFSRTHIGAFLHEHAPPGKADIVFRWGCTANVAARTIVNTAEAIHRVNDKAAFRVALAGANLCQPTWTNQAAFVREADFRNHSYIVRPARHAQGRHVHHVRTTGEAAAAIRACGAGWYASEYINKEAEYRVAVVCGRVAWVARKTPANPQDIAWNVARGGRFDNVRFGDWPLKAVRFAVEAFNLSGLDFGGVDTMVRGNDVYVLEINSAPSLTSPYRQECMAKCFDYIVEHGKERIPTITAKGDWKKWAHPALSAEVRT